MHNEAIGEVLFQPVTPSKKGVLKIKDLQMWNETFTVASLVDCQTALLPTPCDGDFVMRETQIGCKVLYVLQEIYQFNITYIGAPAAQLDFYERMGSIYQFDEHIDIYVKPRSLWSVTLHQASPIMPIFSWRFGYTLRREGPSVLKFYSQPFSTPVWDALVAMLLLVSALFYVLSRAEQRLLGSYIEGGLTQELLIAVGGYCQHYLPVNPMELTSRRIAFFSFFLFSYVIYSYYTSTLLSDLVHDKENEMNLESIDDITYGKVVLDKTALVIKVLIDQVKNSSEDMSPRIQNLIQKKFINIRVVNMTTGLEEMRTGKTALLSDYTSLYSTMKRIYDSEELCSLIEVDLFTNVIKYFFTSKTFKYIEEFKIGILRAKESGVLRRLLENNAVSPLVCQGSHFQARFGHIQVPLIVLACSYILCVVILIGERIYFKRYRLWPYVE